jgi:ArsR family transcriptional regulator, arsenate/arsenite/antimonite-responsive transcriptional repressor
MNDVFKALADPTRRKILDLLGEKDMTAGEISDNFQMSKPSISNHLKILKAADLVIDEKQGQYIYYSLNSTILQDVIKWLLEKNDKGGDL